MTHPVRLRVRRIGTPRWAQWDHQAGYGVEDMNMYLVTGEQPEWGWGIPLVHRAIASPSEGLPVPRKPADGCNFSNALGYWAALLHVCLYSLGWVRPETGLFRMLHAEGHDEFMVLEDLEELDMSFGPGGLDLRLQLIRSVWRRDGDLPLFVAWLAELELHDYRAELEDIMAQRFDQWTFEVDRRWIDQQADRASRLRYPTPAPAGDPLHLSVHCSAPLGDSHSTDQSACAQRFSVNDARTATLTVESMRGWYRTLVHETSALPDQGRNFAVEVYAQHVGWLGTYRRSPTTGVWHAASEDAHLFGY